MTISRRTLLKFLAAPAIIRSGVLMPVVPLVSHVGVDLARGQSISSLYTVKVGSDGRLWSDEQIQAFAQRVQWHMRNWQEIYSRPVGTTDWPPHLAEALRRQPGSLWAAGSCV